MTKEFFKPKSAEFDDGQFAVVLNDHLDIMIQRELSSQAASVRRAAEQVVHALCVLKSVMPSDVGSHDLAVDLVRFAVGGGEALQVAFETAAARDGQLMEELERRWNTTPAKRSAKGHGNSGQRV